MKSAAQVAAFVALPALTLSCRSRPGRVRRSLFDGATLQGWHAVPRLALPREVASGSIATSELRTHVREWNARTPEGRAKLAHAGRWQISQGAIVGGQEPVGSGLGAYLLSDATFGDFDLELEARPDWPVDTGIMLRAHALGGIGFQVLVDHRANGAIGGIFGNGLGNFRAAAFSIDGEEQPGFRVARLRANLPFSGNATPSVTGGANSDCFWRLKSHLR